VVDALDADVVAWEPIWIGGDVVGFCTSGGYSHYTGKSVAMGFVPSGQVAEGLAVHIEILGEKRPAVLVTEPLFDADGARMRG
jgi:dimethylglycine dehydrogenase